jgi:hypothetical protein
MFTSLMTVALSAEPLTGLRDCGASALAGDVGDVQPESGASSGKDTGRRRTGPFVKAEDAASGAIWPG